MAAKDGVEKVLADTAKLVTRLAAENKALKAQNRKLTAELQRVSRGWDQIRELARSAPRSSRGSRRQ